VMGSLNRLKFIQRKVVMKVHIPSLKLTPPAQQRLIALVGTKKSLLPQIKTKIGLPHSSEILLTFVRQAIRCPLWLAKAGGGQTPEPSS